MARWVDVAEAAELLGVSIYTVKRKAKRGELAARQEETPTGFKWFVEVDESPAEPTSDSIDGSGPLEELVKTLQEQNSKLWEEVESKRREVSELHILLQRALQQPQRLQARPEDHPLAIAAATAGAIATDIPAPRRRWWSWLVWS